MFVHPIVQKVVYGHPRHDGVAHGAWYDFCDDDGAVVPTDSNAFPAWSVPRAPAVVIGPEGSGQQKGPCDPFLAGRVVFKFTLDKAKKLEEKLIELHPYENPQWSTWKAEASQGYSNWVREPRK